ncbi:hypothetical protein IE53DRAFT_366175 [Violaceomyces palustris]|uniref:Uncharacterized protein n=1 Tax=Violaceomyces palustris TaxID=1673888 RepID=A0ACD0P6C7_9BASI|nr:hypothetical protein IE53DRAFT_366175 [Violaceomyces palustris]
MSQFSDLFLSPGLSQGLSQGPSQGRESPTATMTAVFDLENGAAQPSRNESIFEEDEEIMPPPFSPSNPRPGTTSSSQRPYWYPMEKRVLVLAMKAQGVFDPNYSSARQNDAWQEVSSIVTQYGSPLGIPPRPIQGCKARWKRIYEKLVENGRHGVATGGNEEEEPLDQVLEELRVLYDSRSTRDTSAKRSAKRRAQEQRQEIRNQGQSVSNASSETYNRARLQGMTCSDGSRNSVAIPSPVASPQSSAASSPIRRRTSSSSGSQAATEVDEALVDVLRKVAGALDGRHRSSEQDIRDMEERIVERVEREMSRQISSLKEVLLGFRSQGSLG